MSKRSNGQLDMTVREVLSLLAGVVLGCGLTLVVVLASISWAEPTVTPTPSPAATSKPAASAPSEVPDTAPAAPTGWERLLEQQRGSARAPAADSDIYPKGESWSGDGIRELSPEVAVEGGTADRQGVSRL